MADDRSPWPIGWILVLALALLFFASWGCAVTSWDVDAKDGKQATTWHWGLEVAVKEWGFYIGPGRNSSTTITNDFEVKATGTGEDTSDGID